jgi:hypothetical protein
MNRAFGTNNPIRLSTPSAESAFSYQPEPNPEFAGVGRQELSWNELGLWYAQPDSSRHRER